MTKGTAALLIIICLAIASCAGKDHVPSGILPRDKMEGVLWDMVLADQYASYLTKDSSHLDLKKEHLRLYEQVFRLHDVTRDKFQKSYKYYLDHPDLSQTLFDSLVNKGNRLRTESYSRPPLKPISTPPPAATPAIKPPVALPPGKHPAAILPGKHPFGIPTPHPPAIKPPDHPTGTPAAKHTTP